MDLFPEHDSEQAIYTKLTTKEMTKWNMDRLLNWIQQERPDVFSDDDLEKLKATRIGGTSFWIHYKN